MPRLLLAILNLFGLPGLGTLLAGHKFRGIMQIFIAISTTLLTVIACCFLFPALWKIYQSPDEFNTQLQHSDFNQLRKLLVPLIVACISLLLFFANWLWSATTTRPVNPK